MWSHWCGTVLQARPTRHPLTNAHAYVYLSRADNQFRGPLKRLTGHRTSSTSTTGLILTPSNGGPFSIRYRPHQLQQSGQSRSLNIGPPNRTRSPDDLNNQFHNNPPQRVMAHRTQGLNHPTINLTILFWWRVLVHRIQVSNNLNNQRYQPPGGGHRFTGHRASTISTTSFMTPPTAGGGPHEGDGGENE